MAAHLQRLVSLQEWEVFLEAVRAMEADQINMLVTEMTDTRFIQGRIQGIREVLRLPERLIARGRRG